MIDYSSAAGDSYHKARHGEIFGNLALIEAWGAYAAKEYFRCINSDDKILEVGAGTGINISYVSKLHSVSIVEPSQYARSHCSSMGVQTFESLESLPKEEKFDKILLRHVLEHVQNPAATLKAIIPHISSGGELVIVLPVESGTAPVRSSDIDHHLYCWNPQTISNLVKMVGYDPTEVYISYHNGRRIFLPVYRTFGAPAYRYCVKALGFLTGAGEIIVRCKETGLDANR
jgi:hypothetical protein